MNMAARWTWSDVERAFLDAMSGAGLSPATSLELRSDGKIHRYTVSGDRSKSDNGWYVLYLDGVPSGAFGSWKTGQSEDWCIGTGAKLTEEERAEFRAKMAEAKRIREVETKRVREEAAARAKKLWEGAKPATNGHPYLQAKRVKAFGLRALREQLMVPVRDESGRLTSLQFIDADGTKRFITGGEKLGNYCAIGKPDGVVCIAEGYATAATILEGTGHAVAVAFDSGNLFHVAKAMRKKFPAATLILCADNDQWTTQPVNNPGLTKAREAARAVQASLVWPDFSAEFIEVFEREFAKKPTDFNDLAMVAGIGAVAATIARAIDVPPPDEGDAGNVVDIDSARLRKGFENAIAELEKDDPEAGELLAARIRKSNLTQAIKNLLYKKIGDRTKLRFADMRRPDARLKQEDFGECPEDFVPELNEKHAITPFGGNVYVMSLEYDPILDRRLVKFYTKDALHLLYMNRRTFMAGDWVPVSASWLVSPERRQYRGVLFAPCDVGPEYFNLWNGWGVDPAPEGVPGEIGMFLEFLYVQICARSEEKYKYLLNWIAHLFQKPMELPEVALVMRSGEGTGKNTLVDALAVLVGQAHFVVLSSVAQVTGQFSGHLADTLLVFANEAIWGGDKSAQGTLKAMISDKVLPVERKGKDIITMANFKRMIFASNESWVVPRGMDDRRMAVFDVSEEHKQDEAYFAQVREEMESEGFYPALMRYFLLRDISDWHPRRIPFELKQAGWDMKLKSADTVIQWWASCLENASVMGGGNHRRYKKDDDHHESDGDESIWPDHLAKTKVHDAYLVWCQKHGHTRPVPDFLFGKEVKKFGIRDSRRREGNTRVNRYYFPALDEARKLFSTLLELPEQHWSGDADDLQSA